MKKLLFLSLSLFLCSLHGAQSQQVATDTITWRDTDLKAKHGLAIVRTATNKTVYAYFPTNAIGFEKTVDYFRKNPEVRPFPKLQYVAINELESMEMRGFHLENMRHAGYPDIMAMRVLEGPVELFAMSGKASDKLPVGMMLVPGLNLFTTAAFLGGAAIERNRWFVRRQGTLVALNRATFREQMAKYTADCLGVSTQIRQGAEGFRYKDTPNIVRLYNEFLQQSAAK